MKSGVSLRWGGLDKRVKNCITRLGDKKRINKLIGEILVSGTIQRFLDEEDPDGQKWAEIEREGKILTKSAGLRNSVSWADAGNAVMVGTNKVYAATHQFGRGNIKARPFIGISAEDKEEIQETLTSYVLKSFSG